MQITFTDEEMVAVLELHGYGVTLEQAPFTVHSSAYLGGVYEGHLLMYQVTLPNGEPYHVPVNNYTKKTTVLEAVFADVLKQKLLKLMTTH